ncbi:MAG: hypothetical protein DRH11_11225, partial [Deltaproteobacteria bacterium]
LEVYPILPVGACLAIKAVGFPLVRFAGKTCVYLVRHFLLLFVRNFKVNVELSNTFKKQDKWQALGM